MFQQQKPSSSSAQNHSRKYILQCH